MELYKGLPIKIIEIERNRHSLGNGVHVFGVTTQGVDKLLSFFFENNSDVDKEIEEFDNSVSYFLPQEIFEADENTIINFINENIDKIL